MAKAVSVTSNIKQSINQVTGRLARKIIQLYLYEKSVLQPLHFIDLKDHVLKEE